MAKFRYLTTPFKVKNLELANRIVMAPMCQFQAKEGMPNDWHYVHYTARAIGGVGLIIVEMTNIASNGRITPHCLGLWNDRQRDEFKKIVDSVHKYGSKIAVQIGHAGRKAMYEENAIAPSPIIYDGDDKAPAEAYHLPKELTIEEIQAVIQQYVDAVKRAVDAGFDSIELHGAHGFLIHQFHAPRTNLRTDEYGQNKFLFGEQVIQAVKTVMPEGMPLIVRISAQEYAKDGYSKDYGVEIARHYAAAGADIFHVSGGGDGALDPDYTPSMQAGYQVYLARAIKAVGKPVIAVGMLEDPAVADYVLAGGDADLTAIGRGLLRDPHWLLNAQYRQNAKDSQPMQFVPKPYIGAY